MADLQDQPPTKRPRLAPAESGESDIVITTSQPGARLQQADVSNVADTADLEKEQDVGIKAFVSEGVVLRGVLKTRYTDFLVREIKRGGEVVRLCSLKAPKLKREVEVNGGEETEDKLESAWEKGEEKQSVQAAKEGQPINAAKENQLIDAAKLAPETADLPEETRQKLVLYLDEETAAAVIDLYRSILESPSKKSKEYPPIRFSSFTNDRSLRGEIHQFIRSTFRSRIDSSTDHDGVLILTASGRGSSGWSGTKNSKPNDRSRSDRAPRPPKLSWADRGGEFLHFTLYKENKDTMEVISYLTRSLKVNAKTFAFAGTKDRRAVTTQRVSAHRIDAERMAAQNRALRNAMLGDFAYAPHGLELGDLDGNEFEITLRDCATDTTNLTDADLQRELQTAFTALHTRGFLNYYGLQRFGTFVQRTDAIGRHILRSDFRAACAALLHYPASALAPSDEAGAANKDYHLRATAIHTYFTTANPTAAQLSAALATLPRKFAAEQTVLRALHKNPSDYFGALHGIPRNLRLMYVHAYQSLVWNCAASRRWEVYADRVVEGDLVLVKEHEDKEGAGAEVDGEGEGQRDAEGNMLDADGDPIIEAGGADRAPSLDDVFERARRLTRDEAESGRYTIHDVVLPLPGYDILYPGGEGVEHAVGVQWYKEVMGRDGLDPEDMRRKHREWSLSGSYRKVMGRIGEGGEVSVRRYSGDEEQFVETDGEKLRREGARGKGVEKVQVDGEENGVEGDKMEVEQNGNGDEKKKLAIVLKFKLGSSMYATMALREFSRGGITAFATHGK